MSNLLNQKGPSETKKAAFYGRFSKLMPHGVSIEDQLRRVSDSCNSLGGVLLEDHHYKDEEKTGTNRNSPALKALLKAAQDPNCPFNYAMVDDPARLGRSTREILKVVGELGDYGVSCYFVELGLDSNDKQFTEIFVWMTDEPTMYRRKRRSTRGKSGVSAREST